MKIPKQFRQFTKEHALIVVAGKQDSLIYDALDGSLNLIDSLRVPRPQYSHNEGHFKARSQGVGVIRSGSVREIRDQEIITNFIRELKNHLSRVRPEMYTDVYVAAPSKTRHEVVKAMPTGLKDKLRIVLDGNYSHTNPLRVIDNFSSFMPTPVEPKSEEANEILKRSF